MQDEYLFKNTSKLRTHISYKAALLVLSTSASSRQGEEVSATIDLGSRLIEILVNEASTSNFHNDPGPTLSGPSLQPEPPDTVQCITDPPFPMATPVTQASCVTPLAPIRDLSAPEPPTQSSETPVNQESVPEPGPSLPQLSRSKSHVISTGNLLQRQQSIRNEQQPKGRRYKSRTVVRRLNLQKEELAWAQGGFPLALAQSVSNQPKSSSVEQENIQEWDGSLSPDDILTLAKQAHNPRKKMTVFETIITESAPQHFHLSASDVLDIQDTTSATEIVRALRRKLPGFMDSERKVNAMKAKSVREFGS